VTVTVERVAVHALGLPSGDGVRRCLVLVVEAGGLRGLGEAAGVDLSAVRVELLDRRPCHPVARAAWATAELDLAARAAGLPAADLLGGRRRRRVRCARRVTAVSPAAVAREVEAAAAAGYGTFDLRAEAGGAAFDLERLGAARWAAGHDAVLRLEVAGGAERARHSLAAFDPLLVFGPDAVVDPAWCGGPAAACELARAAGGPALVRSAPATAIGLAAALHLACALEPEPLDCDLAAPGPFDAVVARGLPTDVPPWLDLPAGPGLGVELDLGALARYRLER
jgi:L-alanine-DL-glutamate epimerase-like enolase superfamily enzyme